MSRESRLKEYAAEKGPKGEASEKKNLDYWSNRAIAPRASTDMKLPSTGKMDVRDSGMSPKVTRSVDARMKAQDDMNVAGDSPYMRGIRRGA